MLTQCEWPYFLGLKCNRTCHLFRIFVISWNNNPKLGDVWGGFWSYFKIRNISALSNPLFLSQEGFKP